jgi:uncharacterized protein YfdQ (DUF2303 family)
MTTDPAGTGDVQAAVDAGLAAAEPAQLDLGGYYAITTQRGTQLVDLTGDQHRDHPKRTIRRVVVDDVASFVTYLAKHGTTATEIYAMRTALAIEAQIDAPGQGEPDWCAHRVTLALQHTQQWLDWRDHDRKLLPQASFAEFIEDHLPDILSPAGAEMLEVAQTLHANTKVAFSSGYRIQDGQRRLTYVEDTTGTAGARGELTIPTHFVLGLEVFRGDGAAEELTARLRYRITDGRLFLGYVLDRPEHAADRAWQPYITSLDNELPQPILAGHTTG